MLTALSGRSPELSKYELLAEIGHGGMATVYRARDRRLGREVAVKVIHHHLRENKEVAARFVSEARAVAKVKHPNIVEVYDVSDADEPERYLVQELVRGTTLRQLLTDRGYLPAEIAAAIAVEVAGALDHAHGLGVIHRDVKPENVLLELPTEGQSEEADTVRSPRVKITDFGIAKLLDVQGVTSTGQVLGSPAHMAPEQIEGGEVSASADVFGLGVLLYESCVGALPFDGKNPAQVLRRVLDGTFTPADRARPTVGAGLSKIVSKALARDAADRYQSARALLDALKEELDRVGFVEPRQEIFEFLKDAALYQKSYEPRLVAELCRRANAARAEKDFMTAAAAFNRALAFRPDDANLLRQVAQIARGERLRRVLTQGAIGLALVLVALGVTLGLATWLRERSVREPVPGLASPVQSGRGAPAESTRAVVPEPSNDRPSPPPGGAETVRRATRQPPKPAPSAIVETATVRVLVDGPKNATVKVDGEEIVWFGPPHEMSVGTHTFEFVPPNRECCVAPQTMLVNVIRPSVPGEVQTVRGTIEFKPALLDFQGPIGATASCGELGSFAVPSQQKIRMETATLHAHCTVLPLPTSGLSPKEFDVTLGPGRLFSIPGP